MAVRQGVLIQYCLALLEETAERGGAVQWRGVGLPLAHPAECQDHPASMGPMET